MKKFKNIAIAPFVKDKDLINLFSVLPAVRHSFYIQRTMQFMEKQLPVNFFY